MITVIQLEQELKDTQLDYSNNYITLKYKNAIEFRIKLMIERITIN